MAKLSEKPPERIAHKGTYGYVAYARVLDGTYPAEEFVNSLTITDQAKFGALFGKLASNVNLQLWNRQQFNQIEDDFWEFKRNDIQMRLFTFRHQKIWYLVTGFAGKKENKLPPKIVKQALRLMDEAKQCLRKKGAL